MRKLQFVALGEDRASMIVATEDGEQFLLTVDERVRAAARGDAAYLGQVEIELESALRPREIQARVRAGESAEEIAKVAGVPVERIRRYEGPVLAERARLAGDARRAKLTGEGAGHGCLEDLVVARLSERGIAADDAEWDAWRRDDGRWTVALRCGPVTGQWTYDALRRTAEAADDPARRLTSAEREPLAVVGAEPGTRASSADKPVPTAPAAEEPASPRPRAARAAGGRASVPAWDDIVFGSRRSAE